MAEPLSKLQDSRAWEAMPHPCEQCPTRAKWPIPARAMRLGRTFGGQNSAARVRWEERGQTVVYGNAETACGSPPHPMRIGHADPTILRPDVPSSLRTIGGGRPH